jgi:hypothetical protein
LKALIPRSRAPGTDNGSNYTREGASAGTYDAAEDPQERRRAAYPLAEEQVRGIMAGAANRERERKREMSFRRILPLKRQCN